MSGVTLQCLKTPVSKVCRMPNPKLCFLFSLRCCHRHDCCYDKAEREGCSPKAQRYQWVCEQNAVRCGKDTVACVSSLLPPQKHWLTQKLCVPRRWDFEAFRVEWFQVPQAHTVCVGLLSSTAGTSQGGLELRSSSPSVVHTSLFWHAPDDLSLRIRHFYFEVFQKSLMVKSFV